jgi:hypothetical protein
MNRKVFEEKSQPPGESLAQEKLTATPAARVINVTSANATGLIVFQDHGLDLADLKANMEEVFGSSSALTLDGLPDVARVAFSHEGLTSDFLGPRPVRVLDFIVTAWLDIRKYYSTPPKPGEKSLPDCLSLDKVHSRGQPGVPCLGCKYAPFGSAPNGRAQACAERRLLYGHWIEDCMAIMLDLPPTSLKTFDSHLKNLRARLIPFYGVVTSVGVDSTKGYPVATFHAGQRLNRAQAEIAKTSHEVIQGILDRARETWPEKAQPQHT